MSIDVTHLCRWQQGVICTWISCLKTRHVYVFKMDMSSRCAHNQFNGQTTPIMKNTGGANHVEPACRCSNAAEGHTAARCRGVAAVWPYGLPSGEGRRTTANSISELSLGAGYVDD